MNHYPPIEYIKQCFRHENGKLYWLIRPPAHFNRQREWKIFNTQFAGKEAGYIDRMNGGDRWKVCINNTHKIYRYIIIWAMHNGRWPVGTIDHKNHKTLDDTIDNLREATRRQNSQNMQKSKRNTSGYKGVSFHKQIGRWTARMRLNGKYASLGCYETAEEAGKAYCEAAIMHHGEFVCTG